MSTIRSSHPAGRRRARRASVGLVAGIPLLLSSAPAVALEPEVEVEPVAFEQSGPRIDAPSPGGVALQAYGGMVAYQSAGSLFGHGIAGGMLLGRLGYFQAGAFYEASDRVVLGSWVAYGGLVGVSLPFRNWVDFSFAVGGGVRQHRNDDARYGDDGYAWSAPALMLRAGVSDRSSESTLGVRVGMEIYATMDLKRGREPWRQVYENSAGLPPVVYSGVTDVGGTSAGLLFTFGFDLAVSAARSPALRAPVAH